MARWDALHHAVYFQRFPVPTLATRPIVDHKAGGAGSVCATRKFAFGTSCGVNVVMI